MATDLQKLYLEARVNGKCGHHGALRAIARQTGIDEASVDRSLKRARRTDELEAKRAKKAPAPQVTIIVADEPVAA